MNILFVCSRNKWRSLTAETIFKNNAVHNIRSAGTENEARVKVNEKLIQWSELIFVMEKRHRERLYEKFGGLMRDKEIVVLNIPDEYKYMDPELIEMLRVSVDPYFDVGLD